MPGMCGRYALTMEPETLYGTFEAEPDERSGGPAGLYGGDPIRPRYNIAPTTTVPVVRLRASSAASDTAGEAPGPVRELEPMRWGLVPSWAKDPSVGNRMFNARAESLPEKGAFRTALVRRRCLVPASGYFEWKKLAAGEQPAGLFDAPGSADEMAQDRAGTEGQGRHGQVRGVGKAGKVAKQAYYCTPVDGSVMAFGGLWEYWKSPEGEPLVSMTIITTDAVGAMRDIHDRMPLILPASEWSAWLDPSVDPAPMLSPPAPELVDALALHMVGAAVGNVQYDEPGLVTPIG